MKRISFFLALTFVILSFGLASAQHSVTVESVDGFYNTDTLALGDVTWHLRVTNIGSPNCFFNPSFPFAVYSPDGANWSDMVLTPGANLFNATNFASGVMVEYADVDGVGTLASGADKAGVAGIASFTGPGLYEGFDDVAIDITIGPTLIASAGMHICLDTMETASFAWEWSGLGMSCESEFESVKPDWAGPFCYVLFEVPDMPPDIFGPATLSESHCGLFSQQYTAEDPDGTDAITFSLGAAPAGANITAAGLFTYSPTLADVNTSLTAEIIATESDGPTKSLVVNLEALNDAPAVADQGPINVSINVPKELAAFPVTEDCPGDPIEMTVTDYGGMTGTITFVGNVATVLAATGDELLAQPVAVTVEASDTKDASTFTLYLNISAGATYQVAIEKTHLTPQGQFVDVDVTLATNAEMGGFNFLMAYDASALTFQGANVDSSYLYTDCGWEYFTYRFGPDGNCGNGCPSGLVRVVGLAETNNGPAHPSCFDDPEDGILFTMSFLVTNDRTYECMYVPIRFFWIECGDNTISNVDGTELYINAKVMDFEFENDFANFDGEMPTYAGAPDECKTSDKVTVGRDIDFKNGGVDIICSKDVDDRGDINLNGLAYEIADAVMFTNYFIYGLSAFGDYVDGATAASDVNADGLVLSVADLVYLIRVIVGDAQPYDNAFLKVNPVNANWTNANGVISSDIELGAAFVVIEGNVTPNLLVDADIMFDFDGTNTKCLVYSMDHKAITGSFLNANGAVVDIEMADINGNPVVAKLLPSEFSLNQNYPNPFNPETVIGFAVPVASDYNLTIYNSLGQIVKEFNGSVEAGDHQVVWDASNNASGVYFYKLTAGDFQATKKMALLK